MVRDAVEIAVAEALNNINEHGGALAHLNGRAGPLRIDITIVDHGPPLPQATLSPAAPPPAHLPTTLPEGGFGWPLIHALTSEVAYQRIGDENRLRLGFAWRA